MRDVGRGKTEVFMNLVNAYPYQKGMANVLRYFELCLRQQNADEVRVQLPVLGLGDLPPATLDGLFVRLAKVCYEYDSHDCLAVLLEAFNDALAGEIEYEAYMFTLRALPDRVLMYVVSHVPDCTPLVVLEQLCANPQEPGVVDGIHRCLAVFGKASFPAADVRVLYERALEQNHADVASVLGLVWSEVMPVMARPSWLVVPSDGLQTEGEVAARAQAVAARVAARAMPELSLEDAVAFALAGMGPKDPERPMAEVTLRAMLQSMTQAERYATLQPLHRTAETFSLVDDYELQKLYGPANPLIGAELTDGDDECCVFGGCRMLLCTCFEEDPVLEEQRAEDWFTGVCDACQRAIAQPWYAVRYPLEGGGWRGCYCSVVCARTQATTLLGTLMLNNLEAQLTDQGIYDRSREGVDA